MTTVNKEKKEAETKMNTIINENKKKQKEKRKFSKLECQVLVNSFNFYGITKVT